MVELTNFDVYRDEPADQEPKSAPTGLDYEDMGKGVVGSAGRVVAGAAGLPGNIGGVVRAGAEYVLPKNAVDAAAAMTRAIPMLRPFSGPDSGQIQRKVEEVTGPFYEPHSREGKYASTLTEFAPAAFMPGMGGAAGASRYVASHIPGLNVKLRSLGDVLASRIGARGLNTVAPAVASETAGQLTEGTPYEPVARFLTGAAAGPAAAKLVSPGGSIAPRHLSEAAKIAVGAASGAAGFHLGGVPGAMLGAAVPYSVDKLVNSRPVRGYLSSNALPQNTRDVLAQTLTQQALSQPSGIERNQVAREQSDLDYQRELRARGFE